MSRDRVAYAHKRISRLTDKEWGLRASLQNAIGEEHRHDVRKQLNSTRVAIKRWQRILREQEDAETN